MGVGSPTPRHNIHRIHRQSTHPSPFPPLLWHHLTTQSLSLKPLSSEDCKPNSRIMYHVQFTMKRKGVSSPACAQILYNYMEPLSTMSDNVCKGFRSYRFSRITVCYFVPVYTRMCPPNGMVPLGLDGRTKKGVPLCPYSFFFFFF